MTSRYETELVHALEADGYAVMRAPASGGATPRDLPDLIVGRGVEATLHSPNGNPYSQFVSDALAIEHKSGKDTTLYVDYDEVGALHRFAEAFGATPFLAARFTTQASPTAHYLVKPEDARITDAGNYGLPIDDIESRASHVLEPVAREAVDA